MANPMFASDQITKIARLWSQENRYQCFLRWCDLRSHKICREFRCAIFAAAGFCGSEFYARTQRFDTFSSKIVVL